MHVPADEHTFHTAVLQVFRYRERSCLWFEGIAVDFSAGRATIGVLISMRTKNVFAVCVVFLAVVDAFLVSAVDRRTDTCHCWSVLWNVDSGSTTVKWLCKSNPCAEPSLAAQSLSTLVSPWRRLRSFANMPLGGQYRAPKRAHREAVSVVSFLGRQTRVCSLGWSSTRVSAKSSKIRVARHVLDPSTTGSSH